MPYSYLPIPVAPVFIYNMDVNRCFNKLLVVLVLGFFMGWNPVHAQALVLDAQMIASKFNKPGVANNEVFVKLDDTLDSIDGPRFEQFMAALKNRGDQENYHFMARYYCLLASQLYDRKILDKAESTKAKEEVKECLRLAMDHAYRSEDDHLIAMVSLYYGKIISKLDNIALAVMYSKNAVDLSDKLKQELAPYDYQFLAEILYKVREYRSSINYANKAVNAWLRSPKRINGMTISCMNTVALGFHRLKIYDSAFIFYNQALAYAQQAGDVVWEGIVRGNKGQLYYELKQYDTAYKLLMLDYHSSKEAGIYDDAANSLQWAARTNLALGNKKQALTQVREAQELLRLHPDPAFLRNIYYTMAQIFREMGEYDSAFFYNSHYSQVNDAFEKMVNTSSLDISRARLSDEASRYAIQNLNHEKKVELLKRNLIIAGILATFIVVFLVFNRRWLRTKHRMEMVEKENYLMEKEVNSARMQLNMFTVNIVEKTNLIEKLELQIHDRENSVEQRELIKELSNQTILTEDEWQNFKYVFEKIYPAFFHQLKAEVSDITLAEQRMAALIKLDLTTRQIASILGISPNSVNKTKQRLRHRLHLSAEDDMEAIIAAL